MKEMLRSSLKPPPEEREGALDFIKGTCVENN